MMTVGTTILQSTGRQLHLRLLCGWWLPGTASQALAMLQLPLRPAQAQPGDCLAQYVMDQPSVKSDRQPGSKPIEVGSCLTQWDMLQPS